MKIEQCIETLKELWRYKETDKYTEIEIREALDLAIEALEQQPCEDCISREQAIKQCGFGMTSLLIADCLKRLPPVTPQPKMGKWIDIWDKNDYGISTQGRCNRCKQISDRPLGKFCKWCGAKMESE